MAGSPYPSWRTAIPLFRYLGVLGLEGDIDLLAGNDKVGHELAMAQLSRKGRKPTKHAVSR